MKKVLFLFLLSVFSIILIGCQNNDVVEPQIFGIDNISIISGEVFDPFYGVSATDDVDGDLTSLIVFSGSFNVNQAGSYTLTYRVKDKSNNEAIRTRILTVLPTPLFVAIETYNNSESMTMSIAMINNDTNYPLLVEIEGNKMKIEGLDEIVYYEFTNDFCYVYEMFQASWIKTSISCDQRNTSELTFFINFSEEYFEKSSSIQNTYLLKSMYYNSLQTFLGSSITSNFVLTLDDDLITSLSFNMLRNQINFEVTITYSKFNATEVVLPTI